MVFMEEQEILNEVQATLDILYLALDKGSLSYTLHEKVVNAIMCLQQHRSYLADLQPQSPSVSNRAKRKESLNRLEECLHDARWILPTLKQRIPLLTKAISPATVLPTQPLVAPTDTQQTTIVAPVEARQPFKLFYSYAEEDERLLQGLNKHLSALKNEGYITEWNKGKLIPGAHKKEETDKQFWATDVILLLISSNYLASDTEYAEMKQALARQKDGGIILPILLRPVDLPEILSSLKTLPGNGKSVTEWRVRDKAYTHIAQGIREAIVKLRVQRGAISRQPVVESSTLTHSTEQEARQYVTTQPPAGAGNSLILATPRPDKISQPTSNSVTRARHCDVLLVTAKQEETESIVNACEQATSRSHTLEFLGAGAYFDLDKIGEARTFLVQSEMGAGGPGGSTLTIQEGIQFLSPSAVILVGIAFGMQQKKQRMGDILVSRQLLGYELQRIGQEESGEWNFRLRGDRPQGSTRLLAQVRASLVSWQGPKVHIGLILSGDKLVDNFDFRELLRKFEPEAIGGEMEGAGLYAAAERNHKDWIVIKAISDWADGKKKYQQIQRQHDAVQNATQLVMHVLQKGGLGNTLKT
jgi:nucleoside phosphorylase